MIFSFIFLSIKSKKKRNLYIRRHWIESFVLKHFDENFNLLSIQDFNCEQLNFKIFKDENHHSIQNQLMILFT